MKHKNEITDIKLTKILAKNKKKKKRDRKGSAKSIDELIDEIPKKYHDIFLEELGGKTPSRRDVDLFLRKNKLTKKE